MQRLVRSSLPSFRAFRSFPSFPSCRRVVVGPVLRALLVGALALCVSCARCVPPPPPPEGPNPVVDGVVDALQRRFALVSDYELAGSVVDKLSSATLRFHLVSRPAAWQAVAEIFDAAGARQRVFAFDGRQLTVIDDVAKTVAREDTGDDVEQKMLVMTRIFADFDVEGWRRPLLKTQGTTGLVAAEQVVLTTAIVDEVLSAQRIVLKTDGTFVKKELIDDHGGVVASVVVLDEWRDPVTGLSFPKSWQRRDRSGEQTVTLEKMSVNRGDVDGGVARFSPAVPAGYGAPSP
jgi:hypothetical protein